MHSQQQLPPPINPNIAVERTQQSATLPPPPPPALLLPPPPLSDKTYEFAQKMKHLMALDDEQFQSATDEVQKKLGNVLKKAEQNAQEMIATGEAIEIDPNDYTKCARCHRQILKTEMVTHLSCHAAIILDNLLLGDKFCAQSKKQLIERMKVTHVVNAARELPNYLQNHNVKYLQLDLYDDLQEQLLSQIEKAYHWIKKVQEEENGIVFVHCAVGKSRSVSVILIYLLREKGMGIREALDYVKQRRSVAQPNISYMKQLLQYQQKLKSQNASSTQKVKQSSYMINPTNTQVKQHQQPITSKSNSDVIVSQAAK